MIHLFSMHGLYIVTDIASGAVHTVDALVYEILRLRLEQPSVDAGEYLKDAYPAAEIAEAMAEIQGLADDGLLFTEEDTEKSVSGLRSRGPVVKALCLHIAHACNLRCAYCFAGQGHYGGEQGLMSLETGKKALDFLIDRSGSRRHLEVDFFGGEPMLNWDVVKGIVRHGRSREAKTGKVFRFTLTTNGTLLDEDAMAFINEHMDNVVLSIDGRPRVHDRMRPYPDGRGSYADILPKLTRMAESRNGQGYYVRGTYTRRNMDFSADVLHLADEGFTRISVEPAVSDAAAPYALRPEDVPGLCAEYEKLAALIHAREKSGRPFTFFHFEMALDRGPCLAKRATGCGAGTEYLAVTPEGGLYPCHQFVGEKDFCVGHLDTGITREGVCAAFAECHVYAKPACAACWARYYCSGGCAANAYHRHGSLTEPDEIGCALQRKRVECALYLFAARKRDPAL